MFDRVTLTGDVQLWAERHESVVFRFNESRNLAGVHILSYLLAATAARASMITLVDEDCGMSRTTYVFYKDRDIWVYDVALGVFLKYLIDAALASDESQQSWLAAAIDSWRVAACISDIPACFDYVPAKHRQTIIALAEQACARLEERTSIPADEMAAWSLWEGEGVHSRGRTEVLTAPIVKLGYAVIALLSGESPEPPERRSALHGWPC
ncbi:MAG: hypothetical protein U0Q16_20580 [Bryobacteraceae bacterium]